MKLQHIELSNLKLSPVNGRKHSGKKIGEANANSLIGAATDIIDATALRGTWLHIKKRWA